MASNRPETESQDLMRLEEANYLIPPDIKTASEKLQEMIDALPLLAKRYETLRKICIQSVVNSKNDWYLWGSERQGYKPRMNDGAALKLLSFSGIKQIDAQVEQKMVTLSEGQQKYYVIYKAKFISPLGGQVLAIGSAASDDAFVATRYVYDPEQKRKVRKDLPQEDVAYDDVLKAARANCLVNGVAGILGLKNVDTDELDALLGDGFCGKIDIIGMQSSKWQPTDNARSFALKMGATEDQIEACTTKAQFDKLMEEVKAAKNIRKGAREQSQATSQQSADDYEQPCNKATLDKIKELATSKGISQEEINGFRFVCWGSKPEEPITNAQSIHIARWMQNPIPAEEYKKMAEKKEPESGKEKGKQPAMF